ncbi:hypothetical protein HDU96_000812 [Phlyctochytrium bullatum]|nr:hypothetical protein HDU96_000812 [Phlyctochytrium bullatum]
MQQSMKAVVLVEPYKVEVRDLQAPAAEDLNDDEAIVKVTYAGLCGSDLHCYRGSEPLPPNKITMGHEFIGELVAAKNVSGVNIGETVIAPFTVSCAECKPCKAGFTSRCVHSLLFGGSERLQGGQAGYVLVRHATGSLIPLRNLTRDAKTSIHPGSYLLCADILPTGYFGAMQAITHPNLSSALTGKGWPNSIWSASDGSPSFKQEVMLGVVGLGPVGLCALVSLIDILSRPASPPLSHLGLQGAVPWKAKILAVDDVESRRTAAKNLVTEILKLLPASEWLEIHYSDSASAAAWVAAQAEFGIGGGLDAVVEAVGSESSLSTCYALLRPFGVISSVGVHTSPTFPLNGGHFYDKNVSLCFGRCPVKSLVPVALGVLERFGRVMVGDAHELSKFGLVDRIVPVEEAAEMYKLFDARKDFKKMDVDDLEEGRPAEEQQSLLEEFERKRMARSLAVPTEDTKVRRRLRAYGQPQTLFGEGPAERRDRLREVMAQVLQERGQEGLVMSESESESEDESDEDDSDGDEDITEEFYTVGPDELFHARNWIMRWSRKKVKLEWYTRLKNDGSLVATAGLDHIGRVWDLRSGRTIMVMQGHVGPIHALDWSPNGYVLATGSADNQVRIWDVRQAKCTYVVPAHTSVVSSLKFWRAGPGFDEDYSKRDMTWTFRSEPASSKDKGENGFITSRRSSHKDSTMDTGEDDESSRKGPRKRSRSHDEMDEDRKENGSGSEADSDDESDTAFDPAVVGGQEGFDDSGPSLKKQLLNGGHLLTSSYDGTCKIFTEGDWKPIKALSGLEGKVMYSDLTGGKTDLNPSYALLTLSFL